MEVQSTDLPFADEPLPLDLRPLAENPSVRARLLDFIANWLAAHGPQIEDADFFGFL